MPAPTVVSDFLLCVRKSGVVEPQRLDDYLAILGKDAPATPAQMADALVHDAVLTRFQADQLLRGRWRNFILCGKYTILEPLGAGGMGTVYLCSHNIMRRAVAVKVLPAAQAADPGSVERFHREAQAVARLRHPNIVGAYDVDRDGKFHFLVLEHVDGVSLQDLVKRCGPLDPMRAAHYIRQAALGLEHAHQAGLVHRDVKPANLLVDRTGVVKILDLGLARFFRDAQASLTEKYDGDAVLGTADYVAPEQAVDSHNVDIRCDIYSLGITFYFLLAGRSPFQEGDAAEKLMWHQVRRPTPIRELRPETPQALAEVLDKMIAKDPARRYQTPADLVEALTPFTRTPIEPPPAEVLPPIPPGVRWTGVTTSDNALPQLPSPSTPTPSPIRPAPSGADRGQPTPQPASTQDELNTRKDGRTAMISAGPVTMMSASASPPAQGENPSNAAESNVRAPHRFPWLVVAVIAVGVLALTGIGIAVGVHFLHSTPVAVTPPPNDQPANPGTKPPANTGAPLTPVPGASVVRGDDGLRVKTAKYEAVVGTDGCLTSLTVGGVEFLRPGEPLFNGKSFARGACFYCEKPPYQGAVPMSQIEQPAANVIKASGDRFSVTYEFLPDALRLKAANATDFPQRFFIVLDSTLLTDVANGTGERLTVPAVVPSDPKWATTTWQAGRAALKISCTDGGDVKLLGPFGQARSQLWEADAASYKTAEIRLEPLGAREEEKPAVPPGGVLITRQGGARRVQTDRYDAIVDGDGCTPSLRVDGVEFFKPGVAISRGAFFHQNATVETLPDIAQWSLTKLAASGRTAGIECDFGPDKVTWSLENRTDAPLAFYVVLDPAVTAVQNAKGEWLKPPFGSPVAGPDLKWAKTTWYAGRAKITVAGGSKMWGPWEQRYQVWEASLAAKEKRQVVVEAALATPDEVRKAAETAGTAPPTIPEASLLAPLDYQVVQRQTYSQGAVPIRVRVRQDFDRLEARVTGKAGLDDAPTGQWQTLPTAAGAHSFDGTMPAPAGGWYRLEVRALKEDKAVAASAVDHVGVGEVFVGAGQSNETNCGETRTRLTSGMASTFSGTNWRPADDPQPGVLDGSQGGSFWPAFGDAMYQKYHVPIGVASVGHSSSSVNDWQPGGLEFEWLLTRMAQLGEDGFRAVLWHQGESDTGMDPDEYDRKMTALIRASHQAAGWDAPWFTALATYRPGEGPKAEIREAQKKLWESGVALRGPDTDELTGDNRDQKGAGIHFSPKGLAAHGKLWAETVGRWLDKVLAR